MNAISDWTESDEIELGRHTQIVRAGMGTFMEVGHSLNVLRDRKLYRKRYANFKEFCDVEFALGRRTAERLIAASKVCESLQESPPKDVDVCVTDGTSTDVNGALKPDNVKQMTELAKAPEDQRRDIWDAAVESANGQQPTAAQIAEAAAESTREVGDEPEEEEVLDDAGMPVPEGPASIAFGTAKEIEALGRELSILKRKAKELSQQIGGRLIRMTEVDHYLDQAKAVLRGNRATHVCPYCHGKKSKTICTVCQDEGWTAKHIWMSAPGTKGEK